MDLSQTFARICQVCVLHVCVWLCKYVRMCVLVSLSYANLIVNSGKNASPEHGEEDRIDRGSGTETAGGRGDGWMCIHVTSDSH